MTTITQNMRSPVASSAGPSFSTTLTLNLVEQPKSPSSTPENFGVIGSSHQEKRGDRLAGRGIVFGLLRPDAEPGRVAGEERTTVAVLLKPGFELPAGGVHLGLADRELAQVRLEID